MIVDEKTIDKLIKNYKKVSYEDPEKVKILFIKTENNNEFFVMMSIFSLYRGDSYLFNKNLEFQKDLFIGTSTDNIYKRISIENGRKYTAKKVGKIKERVFIKEIELS